MTKLDRIARWERRKGRLDGRHCRRGWVSGNPRYSGKSGTRHDERAHRLRHGSLEECRSSVA
jgi:hypothetical protein